MKKMFTPLAPLKKVRPSRKMLLAGGYLMVVAILIFAAIWRPPIQLFSGVQKGGNETAVQEPVNPNGQPAPALDNEGHVAGETGGNEKATPVLTLPGEPMQWPLEGVVLVEHHDVYRIGNTLRAHTGVDIQAAANAEVRAVWPGIVDRVAHDPRLGWLLEIRHGGGYVTQYANLHEEPYVAVGDEVMTGDLIGKVGATAKLDAATGNYLHFAVYRENEALDPVQVISPR